jgi:uncharacterized protein YyaL (SSP411 family)
MKANRLIQEKSPYLLQHAYNPVQWYAWGPEAFDKARQENKMIFLSIGYSTCHWCHVMERESFESQEIAALLNENYIAIKVDREERPDVDQIYMSAVQALTGSGGWPLNVFLTPDAKPITGGTYFPPEDRWGRAGMKTILPRLAKAWKDEHESMVSAGAQMADLLQSRANKAEGDLSFESVTATAFRQFENSFDAVHGGFGRAPKFPRSHDLSFLLRVWKRQGKTEALQMVEKTLEAMANGGIYDHLGGGFARYATDDKWLVPHFEKMLYDEAILARTYLEAYQATRKEFYADVARDIFRYLLRDMTSPEGGFYSAEDADSEGEEGKFYVWRPEEVSRILGPEKARLFNEFYGVTDEGNFEHASSILHVTQSEEDFAKAKGLEVKTLKMDLAAMRFQLFGVRKKRIPPHKDDKILTAWNGMMISALACAAQVLQEPEYASHAARAAEFIFKHLQRDGRLLRRWREGESAVPGFQDDYAFLAQGLLDLYEATFDVRWLEESVRLTEEMIRLFWDESGKGFFYAGSDAEALIARPKEYYDGAVPSGNSIAALLLLKLSRMTGRADYETKAEQVVQSNGASLAQHPVAYPQLLIAMDFAAGPSREIVFAGNAEGADFKAMLAAVRGVFDPHRVMLAHPEGSDAARIEKLSPFTQVQTKKGGKTTVYVCRNQACELPVTTLEELRKKLSENEK